MGRAHELGGGQGSLMSGGRVTVQGPALHAGQPPACHQSSTCGRRRGAGAGQGRRIRSCTQCHGP